MVKARRFGMPRSSTAWAKQISILYGRTGFGIHCDLEVGCLKHHSGVILIEDIRPIRRGSLQSLQPQTTAQAATGTCVYPSSLVPCTVSVATLLVELPPESSTTSDQPGISSEIQNVQASAADAGDPPPPPAAGPSSHSHEDDEEIASVKRVPAATLRLWQSILKPRGFEVQDGRLVRSPSKSQSRQDTSYRREPSPSSRALRRGSLKAGDGEPNAPASAISSFRRARSFAPAAKDVSTPLSRQPFHSNFREELWSGGKGTSKSSNCMQNCP